MQETSWSKPPEVAAALAKAIKVSSTGLPACTACTLCTYFGDSDCTRPHLTTSHLAACGVYWIFTTPDAVGVNKPVSLCALFRQAGASKKAGMTADQVAIIARLKANNAQLNLRPELQGTQLLCLKLTMQQQIVTSTLCMTPFSALICWAYPMPAHKQRVPYHLLTLLSVAHCRSRRT